METNYRAPADPEKTIVCIVDDKAVDIVVCWEPDEVAAVKEKWPNGVNINIIAHPRYDGLGTRTQRQWLVKVARVRAGSPSARSAEGATQP